MFPLESPVCLIDHTLFSLMDTARYAPLLVHGHNLSMSRESPVSFAPTIFRLAVALGLRIWIFCVFVVLVLLH